MFTLLLSAFWFNHQFTLGQWGSVFVVFAGITLETVMKRREATIAQSTVILERNKKKKS